MSMIPRSLRSFAPPMPPMSSSLTLLVRVMVALRVWGLASVPISSSPCNMIHSVVSSRSALLAKLSLPSIVRLPSAGGLTSRSTFLSRGNGDLVASGWHLPVRPGGRIRPARLSDCRRSGILSLNDSEHAAEQECWKERSKKERAMSLTHGINPPYWKMTRNRSGQSIARQSASRKHSGNGYLAIAKALWFAHAEVLDHPGTLSNTCPVTLDSRRDCR